MRYPLEVFAAVRAAEHLCKEHERVEVWSGSGCIFTSAPRSTRGDKVSAA